MAECYQELLVIRVHHCLREVQGTLALLVGREVHAVHRKGIVPVLVEHYRQAPLLVDLKAIK